MRKIIFLSLLFLFSCKPNNKHLDRKLESSFSYNMNQEKVKEYFLLNDNLEIIETQIIKSAYKEKYIFIFITDYNTYLKIFDDFKKNKILGLVSIFNVSKTENKKIKVLLEIDFYIA